MRFKRWFARLFPRLGRGSNNKTNTPVVEQSELAGRAYNIIRNVRDGFLLDINGNQIRDFNPALQRLQQVFDDINQNRSANKKIRLTTNDVLASVFSPIIKIALSPRDKTYERTSGVFGTWYRSNPTTIEDRLLNNTLTNESINEAVNEVKDRIDVINSDVLSTLKGNDYKDFIELITDNYWEYSFGY